MLSDTDCEAYYTGDAAHTLYQYPFPIVSSSDLVVTERDADTELETVLVEDTDYTVAGAGAPTGGEITLTTALGLDHVLAIRRIRPLTQTWDVRNQGSYLPQRAEDSADHIIMICQQLDAGIKGCVRVSPTVDPSTYSPVLPLPEANTVVGWNADGDGLQNVSIGDDGMGGTQYELNITNNIISLDERQKWKPGDMKMGAYATAGTGWLLCNGAAISRTTYADLYAVISTTWGTGDGSTTFNVPDMRGRFPVGAGQGLTLTNRSLGDTGGEEDHLLIEEELPTHHHEITKEVEYAGYGAYELGAPAHGPGEVDTSNVGSDVAHNTMPPFCCINYFIHI